MTLIFIVKNINIKSKKIILMHNLAFVHLFQLIEEVIFFFLLTQKKKKKIVNEI